MKLRSLLAVALLTPAVALAAPSSGTGIPGLEVGGFIGYETADVSGLALRLDGEVPFRDLAPQVKMSWVGSLGYSHLTWDTFGGTYTTNVLKLVPAARFTVPLNPQFSVFGDVGLGLAYVSGTIDVPGFGSSTDSTLNLMMRLGVGAWYQANERLKVGAMLEVDPIFGDFGYNKFGDAAPSQTTFNILVGLMYRL